MGLCSSIQNETWIEVSRENDIEKKWDSFYSIFNYHFNIACPKVRRNIVSSLKSPCINKDAVIPRAKLKDKAYKKEYNVILKTAKANYIQNITTSNNTSKVLWKFVNRERGSSNNILTGNIHLQFGNKIVTSPSRTCNIFNKTVSKLMLDKKPPQTSNNIVVRVRVRVTFRLTVSQYVLVSSPFLGF
jgi:hypothetical protein